MPVCEQADRASLYGLGLLEPAEAEPFKQHLDSCAICEAELRESAELAVGMAETMPVSAVPEALRRRVLSEAVLPRGVSALVRGAQIDWQPTDFEGVSMARLFEDAAHVELASLVRMRPGARYPSHHHGGLEHCYVLEGDLVFEDYAMAAGDYSAGSPDEHHTAATTKAGCLLFIVHNLGDQVHAL